MEMSTLESLRAPIDGDVIVPGDAGFEDARTIWNGMIDREPAAVVRPKNAGDVAEAIAYYEQALSLEAESVKPGMPIAWQQDLDRLRSLQS